MSDHDNQIIQRLESGDQYALYDLSNTYSQELGAIALSITGSRDFAQEVLQDVLVNIWDQRAALGDVADLKSFLRKITRRRAIDLVRREKSRKRMDDIGAQRDDYVWNQGDRNLDAEDLHEEIIDALKVLPPRAREIFMMHWEGGLSYGEIADTLDIARETVHKQMSRAMKALTSRFRW